MPNYANSLVTLEQILLVECPKCGAGVGEACEMKGAGRPQNHFDRVKLARRRIGEKRARRR